MKIILSHPQMGENIGFVARLMSNFGLHELRLVNPRDGWPNEKAEAVSMAGIDVIKNAKVFSSLNDAIADLSFVIGTGDTPRDMDKKHTTSWDYLSHVSDIDHKNVGLLFGCEKYGLSNDEVNLCDLMVTIPTSDVNSSLNLAHAVCVMLYEISKYQDFSISEKTADASATKEEVSFFTDYLLSSLDEADYFKSSNMKNAMVRNVKNIFHGRGFTSQNIRTLFGIIRSLNER